MEWLSPELVVAGLFTLLLTILSYGFRLMVVDLRKAHNEISTLRHQLEKQQVELTGAIRLLTERIEFLRSQTMKSNTNNYYHENFRK